MQPISSIRERSLWIDIAKGIGILLVMVGHTDIPVQASNFIYAFHMPLFFIASGWTTKWDKYEFKTYLVRKIRNLLIPFFIYSTVVILILQGIGEKNFKELLFEGWGGYALWFVPILFFSNILAKISVDTARTDIKILFFAVSYMFIGAILRYTDVSLPWSLCSIPYATSLVLYGSLLSRFKTKIENPRWYYCVVGFLVTLLISHFYRLDIAWNEVLPVVILTIGAIAGCLMVSSISLFLENKTIFISRVLQEIGKETYLIIAFCQVIHISIRYYLNVSTITRFIIFIIILIILKFIKDAINKCLKFKLL